MDQLLTVLKKRPTLLKDYVGELASVSDSILQYLPILHAPLAPGFTILEMVCRYTGKTRYCAVVNPRLGVY